MRTWPLAVLALATALAAANACSSTPAITVLRGDTLKATEPVEGDPLKIKRGAQDAYVGAKPGYAVIRSEDDVRATWPAGHEPPASARPANPERQMLVVAAPETKDLVRARITKVLETANALHVFVVETKRGPGCMARSGEDPVLDVVTVDRIDKPTRFYVEEDLAETCGDPPAVTVKCRPANGQNWSESLTAQPGDVVECEVTAESRGKFAVVDRVLSIGELPGGSTAKLQYTRGPTRVSFPVDVFGTYALRGEATDESGRRVSTIAKIEALPPRTKDLIVQLVWTNFDRSDDPDTFPRVKLRAQEDGKRECAEGAASDSCEVRTRSAFTHMKLKAPTGRTRVTVGYVDERVEKGPVACVQVYLDGKRTAEACDRRGRRSDEKWEVGVIDRDTGAFVENAIPTAGDGGVEGDGGAAEGGARDGGVSPKPAPKAPMVKPPVTKPTPPKPEAQ